MRSKASIAAACTVLIGTLLVGGYVLAQTPADQAEKNLEDLQSKGADNAVVARVNGTPILRRSVDVAFAVANVSGMSDSRGREISGVSKEELVTRLVEDELLAQSAEKAHIVVSDDEVSLAIKSGILDPQRSPDVPEDVKRLQRKGFEAAGIPFARVASDPDVRAGMRRFLLIQRYASVTKKPAAELLAIAQLDSKVEVYLDVLNQPR